MLPEKQKECRKRFRGTDSLLCIDRAVIREVKSRKRNLTMTWIRRLMIWCLIRGLRMLRVVWSSCEYNDFVS